MGGRPCRRERLGNVSEKVDGSYEKGRRRGSNEETQGKRELTENTGRNSGIG